MDGRNSPFSSVCLLESESIQPDPVDSRSRSTNMPTYPSDNLAAQASQLASLHTPHRPLLLTNVWDAATAQIAARNPSTAALATASYAVAASAGVEDDELTFEQNLAAVDGVAAVARKYGKLLTVDVQSGYGDRLEEVVAELIRRGVVGCNLEDRDTVTGKMYGVEEAAGRVERAMAAARDLGVPGFVVNARTDVLVVVGSVQEAIVRGRAYLDAGATTVFVWGGSKRGGMTRDEVAEITKALDGRVSVKLWLGEQYLTVSELAEIGVARISCGPELWAKAMKAFEEEMNTILASTM
jgi:2-methylisocitrate lyase-like PEP mutase family enzyme